MAYKGSTCSVSHQLVHFFSSLSGRRSGYLQRLSPFCAFVCLAVRLKSQMLLRFPLFAIVAMMLKTKGSHGFETRDSIVEEMCTKGGLCLLRIEELMCTVAFRLRGHMHGFCPSTSGYATFGGVPSFDFAIRCGTRKGCGQDYVVTFYAKMPSNRREQG